jgi:hypothetical protein
VETAIGSLKKRIIERCYRPDWEREMRALMLLLSGTSTSIATPRAPREVNDGAALIDAPGRGEGAG